jgi:ATP-dependent protease HslVU (ClpYQ) ATPase subunit
MRTVLCQLLCTHATTTGMTVLGGSPDSQMVASLTQMFKNQSGGMRKSESRKLKIKDARPQMVEAELEKVTASLKLPVL